MASLLLRSAARRVLGRSIPLPSFRRSPGRFLSGGVEKIESQTCITHVARLHSELQSSTMPSGPEHSQTAHSCSNYTHSPEARFEIALEKFGENLQKAHDATLSLLEQEKRTMAEEVSGRKRNYCIWDDEMDDALLEVLVEHHNKGDHAQNGWKSHVYTHAIRHVKDKCNKDITKENISGRMRTLDHHYEIVSKILSQSGFGWDWVNNRLSMDSDDVWAKYLEANKTCKELKSYKTKVIKNWESICIIYSKDHANGEGAKTGAEIAAEPLVEPIEVSLEVAPKRQRTGDAILCMHGDMKDLVDAFKITEPIPLPKVTTPAEILDALQLIPDLAEEDMLRCYGKLVLNDRLFQALKELPITMRKTWLLMLP